MILFRPGTKEGHQPPLKPLRRVVLADDRKPHSSPLLRVCVCQISVTEASSPRKCLGSRFPLVLLLLGRGQRTSPTTKRLSCATRGGTRQGQVQCRLITGLLPIRAAIKEIKLPGMQSGGPVQEGDPVPVANGTKMSPDPGTLNAGQVRVETGTEGKAGHHMRGGPGGTKIAAQSQEVIGAQERDQGPLRGQGNQEEDEQNTGQAATRQEVTTGSMKATGDPGKLREEHPVKSSIKVSPVRVPENPLQVQQPEQWKISLEG